MSNGWESADHALFPYLHKFKCAKWPWRRIKKRPLGYDYWTSKVQSGLRNIRPPLTPPHFLCVRRDSAGEILAVVWFTHSSDLRPDGTLEAEVVAVAVSLDHHREGHGGEALDHAELMLGQVAREMGASRLEISTKVHDRNTPSRRLLESRGWEKSDTDSKQFETSMWSIALDRASQAE